MTEMAEFIEEFLIIWNTYFNLISIQPNDFDKFIIIIYNQIIIWIMDVYVIFVHKKEKN